MSHHRGSALYGLLGHVRPLVLNSARVVEAALFPRGLTVGTRAVLEILAERGPLPVPSIADRLDLARQGVQRHVNDLLSLGYVETRPNPAHLRSVLIAATPAGTRVFNQIRDEELGELAEMASDCSEQEIAVAGKVLRSLDDDIRDRARRIIRSGRPEGTRGAI
jgi:DNA-binding MarR family transcriptional regulator